MDLVLGVLLVIGMLSLIFLGPEWVGGLARGLRSWKRVGPNQ